MYNKLYAKILDSSIWAEDVTTRIVWITFLASMDKYGMVRLSSVKNVAMRANVTAEEAGRAIEVLLNPDKQNEDQLYEGRRIERIAGEGYVVLNAGKYNEIAKREKRRKQNKEAQQRWRDRIKLGNISNSKQKISKRKASVMDRKHPITNTDTDIKDFKDIVCNDTENDKRETNLLRCHVLAARLKAIIEANRKVNITETQTRAWAKVIFSMPKKYPGLIWEEIDEALTYHETNWGTQYWPEIMSGAALKDKWLKLESAIQRVNSRPNDREALRFPSYEEIKNHCLKEKVIINPRKLFDHYNAKRWKIAGEFVKWQEKVSLWAENAYTTLNDFLRQSDQPTKRKWRLYEYEVDGAVFLGERPIEMQLFIFLNSSDPTFYEEMGEIETWIRDEKFEHNERREVNRL